MRGAQRTGDVYFRHTAHLGPVRRGSGVYKVPGVQAGTNGINIQDWNAVLGGSWEHWSAVIGSFSAVPGAAWDRTTGLAEAGIEAIGIRYNGTTGELMISGCTAGDRVRIFDAQGRLLMASTTDPPGSTTIRCSQWGAQALVVRVDGLRGSRSSKVLLFQPALIAEGYVRSPLPSNSSIVLLAASKRTQLFFETSMLVIKQEGVAAIQVVG